MDTNVLVSALLSPEGTPARVFDLVLNKQLLMCFDSRIIAEYETVLGRPKFGFDRKKVRDLLRYITETGLSVIPVPSKMHMPDEDDRKFYDVAKSCGAILVTGNTKHFPKKPFILSAAQFFEKFA